MKKYQNFYLKIFIFFFFLVVKFSVYLNRRVFVMSLIDKMHCLTRSYVTDAFVTNVAFPFRQVVFEYRSEWTHVNNQGKFSNIRIGL